MIWIRLIMIFINIFTPAIQFFAAVQSIFTGTKLDQFTCPSTQQINEKINAGQSMIFPIDGIDGFHYRNANNQRVQYRNSTNVNKLNAVFFQNEMDGRNASSTCNYKDTRGNPFTLAMEPAWVARIDSAKIEMSKQWSSFFGNGLRDCGYGKLPEKEILQNCKFSIKVR